MSTENLEFIVKNNEESRRTSDEESDNLKSSDKCASLLIYIQLGLVALFMGLVITFFSFYIAAGDDTPCWFYSTNSTSVNGDWEAKTTTNEADIGKNDPSANVKGEFSTLFISSGFVYLIDVIFRCIIVFGLCKRSIWFQIGGVVGTIIVSTFATTALLVLIPVYRYNAAGSSCCADTDVNYLPVTPPGYCKNMETMFIIMIIIWFLSCFTSFAIN
jgi:hypothetical protein